VVYAGRGAGLVDIGVLVGWSGERRQGEEVPCVVADAAAEDCV